MSRKNQAKTASHQKSNDQQSSSSNMAKQFSYAQLLCTPSTLSNLDRSPLPWFSDEIRMSDDPRVQWLDFSKTLPVLSQQDTNSQLWQLRIHTCKESFPKLPKIRGDCCQRTLSRSHRSSSRERYESLE